MSSLINAISRVKRQFTSGNNVPVERAAVRAEDMNLILASVPDPEEHHYITGDLAVGSEAFLEDLKTYHNEICLYGGTEMTRLIGYFEDDDDCYYMVAGRYGDKARLLSCVGGLISLKKYMPEAVYNNIENIFALNGSEATDSFEIRMDKTDA